MASTNTETWMNIPIAPFPSETPYVPLNRLSCAKIEDNDAVERQALFDSCKSKGFFLLDMQTSARGREILDDAAQLFTLGKEVFDLELSEKEKYAMLNGTVLGYKGYGVGKIDVAGTPDRCEMWGMSKDDVTGVTEALPAREVVSSRRDLYKCFTERCHTLSLMIMDRLDECLHLPIGTLASKHQIEKESENQTRLLRMIPQPEQDRRTSMVAHTDLGSVTILFNVLGGL